MSSSWQVLSHSFQSFLVSQITMHQISRELAQDESGRDSGLIEMPLWCRIEARAVTQVTRFLPSLSSRP